MAKFKVGDKVVAYGREYTVGYIYPDGTYDMKDGIRQFKESELKPSSFLPKFKIGDTVKRNGLVGKVLGYAGKDIVIVRWNHEGYEKPEHIAEKLLSPNSLCNAKVGDSCEYFDSRRYPGDWVKAKIAAVKGGGKYDVKLADGSTVHDVWDGKFGSVKLNSANEFAWKNSRYYVSPIKKGDTVKKIDDPNLGVRGKVTYCDGREVEFVGDDGRKYTAWDHSLKKVSNSVCNAIGEDYDGNEFEIKPGVKFSPREARHMMMKIGRIKQDPKWGYMVEPDIMKGENDWYSLDEIVVKNSVTSTNAVVNAALEWKAKCDK